MVTLRNVLIALVFLAGSYAVIGAESEGVEWHADRIEDGVVEGGVFIDSETGVEYKFRYLEYDTEQGTLQISDMTAGDQVYPDIDCNMLRKASRTDSNINGFVTTVDKAGRLLGYLLGVPNIAAICGINTAQ